MKIKFAVALITLFLNSLAFSQISALPIDRGHLSHPLTSVEVYNNWDGPIHDGVHNRISKWVKANGEMSYQEMIERFPEGLELAGLQGKKWSLTSTEHKRMYQLRIGKINPFYELPTIQTGNNLILFNHHIQQFIRLGWKVQPEIIPNDSGGFIYRYVMNPDRSKFHIKVIIDLLVVNDEIKTAYVFSSMHFLDLEEAFKRSVFRSDISEPTSTPAIEPYLVHLRSVIQRKVMSEAVIYPSLDQFSDYNPFQLGKIKVNSSDYKSAFRVVV
jgi:hypothetical protein